MTNETPENPQSIPPAPGADGAAAAGQHGFGGLLSSDAGAAGAPESVPAPDAAPAPAEQAPVEPAPVEPVAAPEPVIAPAEPVVEAAPEVPSYPAADAAAAGYGQAPVYPGQEQAPVYPGQDATAAYPTAAYPGQQPGAYPGQDQTAAYAGAAPAYGVQAPVADPNAPQYYPAPAPKKPMSKGLMWSLIGGGALLVLLIAAAIIVPALLRGPAPTASSSVEAYLTAISEGDAETALEYVDPYGDKSLLTDEVLKASNELAPITDIVVEESDSGSYESTVTATFSVGGETVERDFTVYSYSDEFQISDGLSSVSLSYFNGLGLTVNGVEPEDEYSYVFPGTYQLALAYEQFALDSDSDTFQIIEPDDAEVFYDVRPVLTEDGEATFRELVTAAIQECVAMKTLTTPCGMDVTDIELDGGAYTPVDGTVTRTLESGWEKEIADMEISVDYSTPTLVSSWDTPSVDMTLQGDKGGQKAEFEVWFGGYMDYPSVDFAEETPVVTWD